MAVVLCDGAPASLKALAWASVPGHFLRQHEGEHLILTHVWVKDFNPSPLATKEIIDGIPAMLDDPAAVGRLPPSVVAHRTLEAIAENKVTRDSLNYKMETMALIEQPPSPTPSVAPTLRGRPAAHREKEKEREKEMTAPPSPVDVAAAEEEAAQTRAAAVAQHAHSRAVHHRVPALILGAGNRVDGKSIAVGHVAAAVLRTQREAHPLWFVKGSGSTLRANTPAVRYVVVLVPPHVSADEKGDGSGGNGNGSDNGSEDSDADGSDGSGGESDGPGKGGANDSEGDGAAGLEGDARAVAYAMAQCRAGTGDMAAAVVVAGPAVAGAVLEEYVGTMAALLQRGTAADHGKENEQNEQGKEPEQNEQGKEPEQNEQGKEPEQNEQGKEPEQTEQGKQPEQKKETEYREADDEGEGMLWPAVSVCTLRVTKQLPSPTAATAASQVVKFLQQRKIDVVVVSAAAPEPLQLALLGMAKPHVLVLPSSIQCQGKEDTSRGG